jgi:hypothetical protein
MRNTTFMMSGLLAMALSQPVPAADNPDRPPVGPAPKAEKETRERGIDVGRPDAARVLATLPAPSGAPAREKLRIYPAF